MARSGRSHDDAALASAQELAALAAPMVVNARLVGQHADAQAALHTSEERLRLAVEAGDLGIWDWDIVRDRVEWSERLCTLHGSERGTERTLRARRSVMCRAAQTLHPPRGIG